MPLFPAQCRRAPAPCKRQPQAVPSHHYLRSRQSRRRRNPLAVSFAESLVQGARQRRSLSGTEPLLWSIAFGAGRVLFLSYRGYFSTGVRARREWLLHWRFPYGDATPSGARCASLPGWAAPLISLCRGCQLCCFGPSGRPEAYHPPSDKQQCDRQHGNTRSYHDLTAPAPSGEVASLRIGIPRRLHKPQT